ncbi:GroES-like protein [Daedalea quercina L-15889]|uniref:GroES-like protein n=1 Tax=Daedalea quercina L-15889 TaxID=1314783 RepID=A0A165PBI9_9APHY|nr:GroES-like protein [Daedalea quercina L-15889]
MTTIESQKALVLPAKHADFVVRSVPVPKPGPSELLVKIHAVALNPADWKIQKLGYIIREYPGIAGFDIAGVVEKLGEGVEGLSLGDRIFGQGYYTVATAGFQQYTVLNATVVAKIPNNTTFEQASTIPVGLATAALGLFTPGIPVEQDFASAELVGPWEEGGRGKYAGKPFIVFGAGGSIGQYVVQVAKLAGFSPIMVTASLHNADFLRSLGATHVLDRRLSLEQLRDEVRNITSEPLDIIYDAVSVPETQLAAYELLSPGGTLVLVLRPTIPQARLGPGKRVVKAYGQPNSPEENRVIAAKMYGKLTAWLEEGVIKPNRVEVLPNGLHGIPAGLERIRNDQVSGVKLVAHPQETT